MLLIGPLLFVANLSSYIGNLDFVVEASLVLIILLVVEFGDTNIGHPLSIEASHTLAH